ncbi:exportin-5 [Erpetoichthys calabaricus]|uniref:Exportin-5 n=1 Tax=Erpetoichthys calabaricus TaxID=27687 RepID=A0A8C4SNJ1_ERPCA|nr:exportin-5 [Erpetoichthys calabaricus]
MSADQVNALCDQLIKAVNVMMDGESSQRYRLEALKFCEEFKEKCPICVECGLKLAEKSQPALVRHFGLQILEHCVKYRWNNMQQQEKGFLKSNVMGLISTGICPILEEEGHIKDVLSRIVVEMIKREWPQLWPNMLRELESLTKLGEVQTELVMFVLLRVAEDVVTFQTLPTQRRRDIQQTLSQNMDKLFAFFLNILQQNVNKYRKMKTDPSQDSKGKAHCRVGIATLNTLAGYIDWVALNHITSDNCRLLEMLCLLLSETELQLEAAECLLIAVSRKGKLEDRKPLMVLFGDVAMHYIFSAAQSAHGAGLTERQYIFLKRLCQVMCALGNQLCALLGSDVDIEIPNNYGKYLEAFLAFTTHPSQFLRSSTQVCWGSLFRHDALSKNPLTIQTTLKYLRATMTNLVKVGFPSKYDSPSCEYSRMDFDGDEDFNAFFNSFRAQQGEVIRNSCKLVPMEAFHMAGEWLHYQLNTSIDVGPTTSKTAEGLCSIFSPSYVQWDAMTFFTESVVCQLFRVVDKEALPLDDGVKLLQEVLNYETRDPLILSCVLTNVSTFFPFVKYRTEFLPQVLSKLFASVTFEVIEESKAPRTRAVKNVRRHACSSIIKMCRDYPQLIHPCFDMLYNYVKQLFSNEMLLTQMEKCALMEALVLVSNQFKCYEKQKIFLEELMGAVSTRWLSGEMTQVLSDPGMFVSFVGADQTISDPISDDPCGINRSRISFCVYTILGVVKRARWPRELEEAKAGGFVVGYAPNGNPIFRNPCSEQVGKLLDNLLALIRTHNNLFSPEHSARLSETFSKAFDMMEVEKNAVLGLPQPLLDLYDSPVYKTVLERMQGFFCTLYDNCYHILGNAGPSLEQDFYNIPSLAEKLVNSAFINLVFVPDYRLRPMLRVFLKLLVVSCPAEYYDSLICPILRPLFSFLLQRLNQKWQILNQKTSNLCDSEESLEEGQVSQEMLEEQLLRLVTREVVDLICVCCIMKKGAEPPVPKDDLDEEEMMATDASHTHASDELTELGKCLLKHEELYTTLLTIAFSSLSWKDTITSQRTANQVCWPLLKQVIGGNLLGDAVSWFFISILRGLHVHGQHEGCSVALTQLAFVVYETLRPRYIELKIVMEQIPNIQKDDLAQFDMKLMNQSQHKISDKKRKDYFKRLISGSFGKPLGQQFKKEVHIKNLPSLFKKTKPEAPDILDTEKIELASLFTSSADDI